MSSDGWVSGTPTAAGASTFAVTASNGSGPDVRADPITVTVSPAPQVANLPDQQVHGDATPPTANELAVTGNDASLAAPLLGAGLIAAGVIATGFHRRHRTQE